MHRPELHLLITALSESYQELRGGRTAKHCRMSSSLSINRDPEAYSAIATRQQSQGKPNFGSQPGLCPLPCSNVSDLRKKGLLSSHCASDPTWQSLFLLTWPISYLRVFQTETGRKLKRHKNTKLTDMHISK